MSTEFVILTGGEPEGGVKTVRTGNFRYAAPRGLPYWPCPFRKSILMTLRPVAAHSAGFNWVLAAEPEAADAWQKSHTARKNAAQASRRRDAWALSTGQIAPLSIALVGFC